MGHEIFNTNIDPDILREDREGYERIIGLLSEESIEPLLRQLYEHLARRRYACYQAVDQWGGMLKGIIQGYSTYSLSLGFNPPIEDTERFVHSGQDFLAISKPGSIHVFVADVGGYLFDFPFTDMFMAAGNLDFITKKATLHYQQRYPGVTVTT